MPVAESRASESVVALPDAVHATVSAGGQPLENETRATMASSFGGDFSHVRIHDDAAAAQAARSLGARAFTLGHHVGFAPGQYAPRTREGRSLLAHELAHVVQNDGAPAPLARGARVAIPSASAPVERDADRAAAGFERAPAPGTGGAATDLTAGGRAPAAAAPRLSLARFNIGNVPVEVNYGNLVNTPAGGAQAAIEAMFTSWTGQPAAPIQASVAALSATQQDWVLYGIDLLMDNTTAQHGALNRADAVRRLIAAAPSSTTTALGSTDNTFEQEVLHVSGWLQVALAAALSAPAGADAAALSALYNPPTTGGSPTDPLDVALLNTELPPALKARLMSVDPGNWTATGTQSIGTLQTIADAIQGEARSFFSPYADAPIGNAYAGAWTYSAHISSVTSMVPTQDQRIGYLLNRAEGVGRASQSGGSIFSRAHFESGRDQAALLALVTNMESSDPDIPGLVDRLIQHTGRTSRATLATTNVGVSTEYNQGTTSDCEARWRTIETLSHELMHVLVNPRFPPSASTVSFGQIIREGFTEVLGVQLYDRLRQRAAASATFKSQLEAGVSGPCPAPPAGTIGYGAAGASAEQIRGRVGNNNFRAAYFLGALNLVGL